MKKSMFLALILISEMSFAGQELKCKVIDGNIKDRARVSILKMDNAKLVINDDSSASFSNSSNSGDNKYSPEFGPYDGMIGLYLDAKESTLSKDGKYLSFKQKYIHCGKFSATNCNTYGTFDTQTKQLRVTTKIGIVLVHTEVDYLMQCQPK